MLNKTVFLATILLFTLLTSASTLQAKPVNKTQIQALIDNGVYLTSERWRVRPRFISIPSQFELTPAVQCYQSSLENFLNTQLKGQRVKIKFDKDYKSTQLYRTGVVTLAGKYDLAEFLLSNGWAQLDASALEDDIPKTYRSAQKRAQKQRLGMWGQCDNWYKLREKQRLQGQTTYLPAKQRKYLGASSMGWVQAVLDPTTFMLDSGQKIKFQALKTPVDSSELSQCWRRSVTKALEAKLVGRKVELEHDALELTPRGKALQRFVWLNEPHNSSRHLLNAVMIQQGWAQLDAHQLNLKNIVAMKSAQTSFQNQSAPPEWWRQCAQNSILTSAPETSAPKTLSYDSNCRIKGNVAGSKKNPRKTYHTPLSGWYKRIEAEQCFGGEAEAIAAGFEKIK